MRSNGYNENIIEKMFKLRMEDVSTFQSENYEITFFFSRIPLLYQLPWEADQSSGNNGGVHIEPNTSLSLSSSPFIGSFLNEGFS